MHVSFSYFFWPQKAKAFFQVEKKTLFLQGHLVIYYYYYIRHHMVIPPIIIALDLRPTLSLDWNVSQNTYLHGTQLWSRFSMMT
jgi:hypothetical protein